MPKDGQPGSASCKIRIGNRDHWTCGICTLPIDPELSVYATIWAAVVDHIVSKRDGGGDRDDNLQIAHYECNRRKHAVRAEAASRTIFCPHCWTVITTRAQRRTNIHCWQCHGSVNIEPPEEYCQYR